MKRSKDTGEKTGGLRHCLRSRAVGICVAVLGLLLAGWGIYRGEMAVVFEKAVNICMECIGIG